MNNYPLEFFQLQADFALHLSQKHKLSLQEALFRNTAFYVRIIGHSDENLPDPMHPQWQKLIASMPADTGKIADYFYDEYLKNESQKKHESKQITSHTEACFHVYYHQKSNRYELHLDNNDPEGVLAHTRIAARKAELQNIYTEIVTKHGDDPILYVRTWLLNVNAFNRLFPNSFSQKAILWDSDNKTYDNTHWGQFLDRHMGFRSDLAMEFREKWQKETHTEFNLYFPLPAKYSELPVSKLIETTPRGWWAVRLPRV